jgi:uncharacterized protein (UPF0332 family)
VSGVEWRVSRGARHAASALLLTKGITRSKHSGVISAFRKYFVKTGLIQVKYSEMYGRVMDARLDSDYDVLISVRAIGRSHWERISRYRFPFYQSLEADGIPLTGDAE